ncbi:MAG: hypothetical protein QXD69_05005 [Candidatus Bathyarchaeia archaeon]
MLDTLKKTRNLFIELSKREMAAYKTLKALGFKLVDRQVTITYFESCDVKREKHASKNVKSTGFYKP